MPGLTHFKPTKLTFIVLTNLVNLANHTIAITAIKTFFPIKI